MSLTSQDFESFSNQSQVLPGRKRARLLQVSWAVLLLRVAIAGIITSTLGLADIATIGVFSFNTLIPGAPGSPGVNDFAIDNFTGSFSLPPDFPATDSLTFLNASVVLTAQGGSQQTIDLGDLGPGSYTPASLQFSAGQNFGSALFTATLSPTTFLLGDGSSFQATSSQITVALAPSVGPLLSPDVDFAPIAVSNAPSVVPEPRYTSLMILALAFIGWRKKRSQSNGRHVA